MNPECCLVDKRDHLALREGVYRGLRVSYEPIITETRH